MPITDIDPNFSNQIEALSTDLQEAGGATQGTNQRAWMLPTPNGWNGSPFSLAGATGMNAAFTRDELNAEYGKAIDTSGQAGGGRLVDRMAAKTQADYLGGMERAFRARHMSPIRGTMLAAARMAGQGQPQGVLRSIQDYVASTIAQGYSAPASPPIIG